MQKLIKGIQQFQQSAFELKKSLFERLSKGQQPSVLLITCSDSRIDPNLITQTDPGDLFVIRNAGNIVPPYGAVTGGEAATIEYAVSVLKVPDIIICGHSHCGAMGGLLAPESLSELPGVKSWLDYAEKTAQRVKEKYSNVEDKADLLNAAVEQNVLVQLQNLKTHPCVDAALKAGKLKVHGWVYRFESGEVFAYHPDQANFELLHTSEPGLNETQLAAL